MDPFSLDLLNKCFHNYLELTDLPHVVRRLVGQLYYIDHEADRPPSSQCAGWQANFITLSMRLTDLPPHIVSRLVGQPYYLVQQHQQERTEPLGPGGLFSNQSWNNIKLLKYSLSGSSLLTVLATPPLPFCRGLQHANIIEICKNIFLCILLSEFAKTFFFAYFEIRINTSDKHQ